MLEFGFSMALLGSLWFCVASALGMWRDGVLFDVPWTYAFINLGVWVGGGLVLGIGFWFAVIGIVIQLVGVL